MMVHHPIVCLHSTLVLCIFLLIVPYQIAQYADPYTLVDADGL